MRYGLNLILYKKISLILLAFLSLNLAYADTVLPTLTIKAKKIKPNFSKTQSSQENLRQAQQVTVVDALKNTPGVHIVQAGGVGKAAHLFVRGTNPEHVLVLIDGMRAHDPSSPNGGFDFGQFETESLEKIEVLRGPLTANYGSDAVGGVVKLTTQKGQGETRTTFTGEVGSFQSYRQGLSVKGEKPKVDYYVDVTHRQVKNPPSTPLAYQKIQRQSKVDPYDSQNYVSHCGAKIGENWQIRLNNRHQNSRSRYVNEFNSNPNSQDTTKYDLHSLTVKGEDREHHWLPHFQVGFLQSDRVSGYDNPPYLPRSFYRGQVLNLQWHNHFQLNPDHSLYMNMDHHHQSYKNVIPISPDFESAYQKAEARNHEATFGVGQQIKPYQRLKLTLSGRWHRHSQFKSALTCRAAVIYDHLETDTDVYTSYGTVIHNPSLYQLFDRQSGNSQLRPEKGYGWEVGIQQYLRRLLGANIQVGTVFFQTRLRDLIVGQRLTPLKYRYGNIDASQSQGFGSFILWKLTSDLQLRLDHLYTSAKDLNTRITLPRRPLHKVLAGCQWQMTSEHQLNVGLTYDGKQADLDRFPPYKRVYKTGPLLVRATLNYKPQGANFKYDQPSFFARIENMLDHSYEQPAGYTQPGVGVFVGLRLTV